MCTALHAQASSSAAVISPEPDDDVTASSSARRREEPPAASVDSLLGWAKEIAEEGVPSPYPGTSKGR